MYDLISKQGAIDALWKALYDYEDKTEKQFLESEELNTDDWFRHRIFVQNMSDIDRQTIINLPSAQQWVPCSERMPENDFTDVLICVHDKRKGCENDFYVIQAYTAEKHWFTTLHVDMMDFNVDAWMPLPEPYKEKVD